MPRSTNARRTTLLVRNAEVILHEHGHAIHSTTPTDVRSACAKLLREALCANVIPFPRGKEVRR
jgi:hypothetical protein